MPIRREHSSTPDPQRLSCEHSSALIDCDPERYFIELHLGRSVRKVLNVRSTIVKAREANKGIPKYVRRDNCSRVVCDVTKQGIAVVPYATVSTANSTLSHRLLAGPSICWLGDCQNASKTETKMKNPPAAAGTMM